MRKVEKAIERYLGTFEKGTLPERHCGTRVGVLAARLEELRSGHANFADEADDVSASDGQPISTAYGMTL
jgi:hypothetical protein